MSFYRSIIRLAVLLFCTYPSGAQDNNYVYKDTTILYADSVKTKAIQVVPVPQGADENGEESPPDTMLRNNQLTVESDSVNALKNSNSFAYARKLDSLLVEYQRMQKTDVFSEKEEVSWLERFFLSPITRYFFWILAGIFVSIILYKLFFAEGFFQHSYAKANVTLLADEREMLPGTADYGKLIAQAVRDNRYRTAVRYHYLQSLQKLSLKGAILFAADKTNDQYVSELSGKTYRNAFVLLTRHYEYVWYGEFEIDEDVFNAIQNKFKQFNSEVQ